jgi:hypothetical protein
MLAPKQRRVLFSGALLLVAFSLVALGSVASRRLGSTTAEPSSPSREQPQVAAKKARALPEVSTLYEHGTSAYHARLFADEDAVVLITQTGFTTFRAGRAPEEHAVSLGPVAIRQGGSVYFWRSGSLREISLSGESDRSLAALQRPPQYLLASEGHLAWIDTDRKNGYSLQTLSAGDVRVVFHSADSVGASVMRGDVVYWVLQGREGSWRIGRVGLDGQQQTTQAHQGRPPAMLALGPDGVYFYDGPERGVRKLTFDLERESAVVTHVICSPLVVSSRVVCANVGGLFDIPASGTAPRFLASEHAGPITSTAATDDRAFWVAENGDALIVRAVPLAGR